MNERKKSEVGVPKSEIPKEVKAERLKPNAVAKSKENNSAIDIPCLPVRRTPMRAGTAHSEIKELQTENSKLQTEPMEVHHHPEVEKKGFKEYLLEGLMIFLAVTMGFFAETIRENISESGKAKELGKSLYQEIYKDSVAMHDKIVLREQKDEQMIYFMRYLKDSSLTHLSDQFYPSFTWTYIVTAGVIFDPNDGILNQLRNSGTLRYFKSIELQNAISNINTAIFKVRDRSAHEYTFNEQYLRPFMLKYYDFIWYDAYTQKGKLPILQAIKQTHFHSAIPAQIRNAADLKRDDAVALASYYMLILRSTKQSIYAEYVAANHALLHELRKEYHFENE